MAVGIIALLSVLLCWGTKESSTLNLTVTAVHITIMIFIVVAGFIKGDGGNLSPFTPFGVRGVFDAATQVRVNGSTNVNSLFSGSTLLYSSLKGLQDLEQTLRS